MAEPRVSSFAPEMLMIFREANNKPIEIVVESKEASHRLQFRLHQLRRAMRRELHELTDIAEGCIVKRFKHPKITDRWVVRVEPADSGLLDAIKRAGISVEDPDAEPLPEHDKTLSQSAVDKFMSED